MTAPAGTAREQAWQAYETAWKAYDAIARDLPDCEHVREWQAQVEAARTVKDRAIRAYDRGWQAQVVEQEEQ